MLLILRQIKAKPTLQAAKHWPQYQRITKRVLIQPGNPSKIDWEYRKGPNDLRGMLGQRIKQGWYAHLVQGWGEFLPIKDSNESTKNVTIRAKPKGTFENGL
jgi:hypothetical protein